MRAPEFPLKATWLNTETPLSLEELRGHVVLLDFWTYCCINCLHVLPTLERLEEELADEPFVVIGVHAAKFDQEKDVKNISMAVSRHGVTHPILADSDHDIWKEYTIRAWPSLVLINSEGLIVEELSGEPDYSDLLGKIRKTLSSDRNKGALAEKKIELNPGKAEKGAHLSFPGKVKHFPPATKEGPDRLIISDTGNHRIHVLEVTADSSNWPRVESSTIIGNGGVGRQDGTFASSSFRRPQGVSLLGDVLYICDTENHLIRAANLKTKTVTTVAGTGSPTMGLFKENPLETGLRSPWDCAAVQGEVLIVAMAGYHQLWMFDPRKPSAFPVIGGGREDHVDGSFEECALAQPSSIDLVGVNVIFADSEISSIRIANFQDRKVRTIVGRGLFDFGDVDGPAGDVLLQHPLGAVFHENSVYVADTFNNKIKKIDLGTQTGETFYGDGSSDQLYEPGGLGLWNDMLLIPDTNNHRIQLLQLSGKEVRTLDYNA